VLPFESLEELLTSEFGFGLKTATPVQRAVCWIIQNGTIPDRLWDSLHVQQSFGGIRPEKFQPEILLLCGIRSAKTLICAAACVWLALTVNLTAASGLSMRKGERPAVFFVSRNMENAREAMNYVVGALQGSFFLRGFMVGKPKADSVVLQHPSGTHIVIRVVAMSTTGVTLVSRWCVSVLFDEAPRMASEDEGKVNLKEQVQAVRARVLKGGVIFFVGSPYGAKGYVYDLFSRHWQKPGAPVTIVRARGSHMNPVYWNPAFCAELQARDQDTFRTDEMAEFRDPEEQLYSVITLEQMFRRRELVIPYDPEKRYAAAMDPGESNNAWTFGIVETPDNRRFTCVYACEWRGSKTEPLSPKRVLTEVAAICAGYRVETVLSDQFMASALVDIGRDVGIGISPVKWTGENKTKFHLAMHARALEGQLDLPPIPEMRQDFIYLKRRLMTSGDARILLTETADGRHCDYASLLAALCGFYLDAYADPAEAARLEAERKRKRAFTDEELEEIEAGLVPRDWAYDDEPLTAEESWL